MTTSEEPKLNPAVALIKAKRATADTECTALQQQSARTAQFLNEVNTKGLAAQAKRDAYDEILKELDPQPIATTPATENPNAPESPSPAS